MRVALVRYHDDNTNTRIPESLRRRMGVLPHMGLGYIAANLIKHGHDVKLIDAQIFGLTPTQFRDVLSDFDPELVGITCYTPTIPGAVEAAKIAKSLGARVVLGGPHTEVFSIENLCHECFDYVCVGEGEEFMVQLCDALEKKKDLREIPGICFRTKEGGLFQHPQTAIVKDLNSLPWPERASLPVEKYDSIMSLHPVTTMMSMRGCPYKCGFCFKQEVDLKMRYRDPKDVAAEMGHVVEKFGIREILFYDDTFTLSKKHVHELCQEIKKQKVKVQFQAPTRINCVTQEMLYELADAGCRMLRFGIESGDPIIQRDMQKENDLRNIAKVLEMAKNAGIKTFSFFMVGYIGETKEQFYQTIKFMKELKHLDLASITATTPLPGTLLHYQAVEAGLIDPGYWLEFVQGKRHDRINYLVPDAELRAQIAFREFYLRPRTLLNRAFSIRSFNEFQKNLGGFFSVSNFRMSSGAYGNIKPQL